MQKAVQLIAGLSPNEEGFICSVAGMNQVFSRADYEAFLKELLHSIRVAPQVIELSNQLKKAT